MHRGPTVLDATALADLAAAVGKENVPMLVETFADDLRRLHQHAVDAVFEGDTSSFAVMIHSLQGFCSYFGASDLCLASQQFKIKEISDTEALAHYWHGLEPTLLATVKAAETASV